MITDADFTDCRDCLCAAARREAQLLTRLYDEQLRPFDLTVNQFTMLTTLIVAGSTTMSVLAERLGVDRTTLSRNVTLSAERKLVKVSPGKDARERIISMTPLGRRRAEEALPAWRAAQALASAT
jgi:DNA-binding MarR family transcriptional regulator